MGCCAVFHIVSGRFTGAIVTVVKVLCFGVCDVLLILSLFLSLLHVVTAAVQHTS